MKRWTEKEEINLANLYGKHQNKEIALILGRSVAAVSIKAKSLGLKGNPSRTRRQHNLNDGFFEKHTLEACYWAGFIAADGNISSPKRKKANVRIKLKDIDVDHLEMLKKSLKYENELSRSDQKGFVYYTLSFFSEQIVEDLKWFNIIPKKSLVLNPPPLDGKKALSFIIGYIDGDGCVYLETLKKRNPRLRLCLVGTEQMLLWIKFNFDKIVPFSIASTPRKIKNSKIYQYQIASKKALDVLNYLNLIDVPKMQRKWKVVEYYNEQIVPLLGCRCGHIQ